MGLFREGIQVFDLIPKDVAALTGTKMASLDAVYVISTGEGLPCKIGHAVVPARRLSALQTSHWEELYLAHVSYFYNSAHAAFVEAVCHKIFQSSGTHIRGEWFNITVEEAIDQICRSASDYGVPRLYEADKIKEKWKESAEFSERQRLQSIIHLTDEQKANRHAAYVSHIKQRDQIVRQRRKILSEL